MTGITNQDITVTATTNKGVLNTSSYTFTGNGSFDFIATDALGNTTTQTVTITNIDKDGPIISIAPYTTGMTNQDVAVTASTNEGMLNATWHTFTGNSSFDFIATDALGNTPTQTVTITNIDKENPVITVAPYMTGMTNQDIAVTATTSKGELNTPSYTFTGNGSFDFIATDAAGNTTTQTITIANIDKISPVIAINGEQIINLTIGNTYNELGAWATDNYDTTGQLALALHTTSSVNTAIAWSYTVVYTVSDTAGNVATPVTRTVNVKSSTVSNWWGGWWGWWGGGIADSMTKDYCPDGDFSDSYYDKTCGVAKVVTKISSGSIENNLVGDDGYIPEFDGAYEFAFENGITTMPTAQAANMTWVLTRIDMAKMLVNYAINILGKTPNTSISCKFADTYGQIPEMKDYAIKACQLWLMGKGKKNFMPNNMVTRDQLGSALSRMLYATPERGAPYYLTHLTLLKQKGIIKDTNPNIIEVRWYAMLMLMRTVQ